MVDSEVMPEPSGDKLPEYLLDFVKHRVDTFIKWDLVRFFHDNPHTKDTASTIARYVSRDLKTVTRELNGLAASGVLARESVGEVEVYALAEDSKVRSLISSFMEACHDRQFRVQVIHQVISNMQFTPRHDF